MKLSASSLLTGAVLLLALGRAAERSLESKVEVLTAAKPKPPTGPKKSDGNEAVNAKCQKLLESSMAQGKMAPLTEDYMSGFADLMSDPMKKLVRSTMLGGQESQLLLSINQGLQTVQHTRANKANNSLKGSSEKLELKKSGEKKKASALRPDGGIIYVSAVNSKAIFSRLIEDLDPSAVDLRRIPNTKVRYFSIPHSADSTSPKIIFFAPELPDYDPLALGEALTAQRIALHEASIDVKNKVADFLVENQEKNAQIVFTGFASGAHVAQLAATRLMFDPDLRLYLRRHRVISIVFGDVRIFSTSFIASIGAYGFDHHDHLCFCSTEQYLPINIAQYGKINYVGKRIVFELQSLQEKWTEPAPFNIDLTATIILASPHPLLKYMHWNVYKTHSLIAFEAYEATQAENKDKTVQIPKAIEALQNHFKTCRLSQFTHIFVDCVKDPLGDELDTAIPSSRLICTIKDTNTKAELQLFFRIFWSDDVHDINEKFLDGLLALRKSEYQYVSHSAKAKPAPSTTAGLQVKKSDARSRFRFSNWVQFFRGQLSENVTPTEAASRLINPFFDHSTFFELEEGGQFKYSLALCSEMLMRKLLSPAAHDQKLIKIVFGPLDNKHMYRHYTEAKLLFRAPDSKIKDTQGSLTKLVSEMFRTQVPKPVISEFVSMGTEKVWGDFKITKMDSMHMNTFSSTVQLSALIDLFNTPDKGKDCSNALPAKHCPKMSLLELDSPFWHRMYRLDDIYVAYRGSDLGYHTQRSVRTFCDGLQGRDYDKIGSAIILEIVSQNKAYGSYISQYTFYMMVIQDPLKTVS